MTTTTTGYSLAAATLTNSTMTTRTVLAVCNSRRSASNAMVCLTQATSPTLGAASWA